MSRPAPYCEYNGTSYGCGGDNCRIRDNMGQEHHQLNGFFTLGHLNNGTLAQSFDDSVPTPKRTKHRKEAGSAVSTFEFQANPSTVQRRAFVNNAILSGYRAPRMKTNAKGGQLEQVEIPLFRTAVYKGNGPVSIGVESELRFQHSRGGSDKSCRTIMTQDFNRWERDLRFDPQRTSHVVHTDAGLPRRGGIDIRSEKFDVLCSDDSRRRK